MPTPSLQTRLFMAAVAAETPAQRRQFFDEATVHGATAAQVREAWLRGATCARQFDPPMVDAILGDTWSEWIAGGSLLVANAYFCLDVASMRHFRRRLAERLVRDVTPVDVEAHAAAPLLHGLALREGRVGESDGPALLALLRHLLQAPPTAADPLREALVRMLAGVVPMTAADYVAILPHLTPTQLTQVAMREPVMPDLWVMVIERYPAGPFCDAISNRLEREGDPRLVLDLVHRLEAAGSDWRRTRMPGLEYLAAAVAVPHLFCDRLLQLMDYYPTHARAALQLAPAACLATLDRAFLARVVRAPEEHVRAFSYEVMERLPRRSRAMA